MEGSVKASGVVVGNTDVGPTGRVAVTVARANIGRALAAGVAVEIEIVGRAIGVFVGTAVGIALCVSATTVLTVAMAVSMISASLIAGVDWTLLQDASTAARNKKINVLPKMFIFHFPLILDKETP